MHLDLTEEESSALLNLLRKTIDNDRYPLSPRIRLLRAIMAKFPMAPPPPPPARPLKRPRPSSWHFCDLLSTGGTQLITSCSEPCLAVPGDSRKWTNKEAHNCGHMATITARSLAGYVNLL